MRLRGETGGSACGGRAAADVMLPVPTWPNSTTGRRQARQSAPRRLLLHGVTRRVCLHLSLFSLQWCCSMKRLYLVPHHVGTSPRAHPYTTRKLTRLLTPCLLFAPSPGLPRIRFSPEGGRGLEGAEASAACTVSLARYLFHGISCTLSLRLEACQLGQGPALCL